MGASPTLNVLGLVDLHWSGRRELRLPTLDGIDLVLLGGDLTNFRGVDTAREIVERIGAEGPQVLAVCGNCDLPEIEGYLEPSGIGLDRRAMRMGDARFLGLSGGLPFGGCPYERTEADYAEACRDVFAAAAELGASGPTILLSHQPPYGTCCDRTRGQHVGCRSLRSAIEEHQPDLVLCGHIHESAGSDTIGASRIVNPGPWFRGGSLRFEVTAEEIRFCEPS